MSDETKQSVKKGKSRYRLKLRRKFSRGPIDHRWMDRHQVSAMAAGVEGAL